MGPAVRAAGFVVVGAGGLVVVPPRSPVDEDVLSPAPHALTIVASSTTAVTADATRRGVSPTWCTTW